jgi:hypothetical protein
MTPSPNCLAQGITRLSRPDTFAESIVVAIDRA